MPIYEFECDDHGVFELSRTIAQVRDPAACPDCGASARRVLSAPNLASGSLLIRAAAVNERSQHEPRIVSRQSPRKPEAPHKRKLHSSRGGYPWALGH